ncbi:MAG TPA: sigma-70 family RNA polymerase sigma factor [Fimbriimonadaceae bacterium]|nr:sigma-70 family RNA polymerase sigma factor [Fimbriimonadaceae bacterium]
MAKPRGPGQLYVMTPVEAGEAKRAGSPSELADMFSDEIWRFASSQLARREDAEDVAMEVFAAAFAQFDKLTRVEDQRLWLLAVARKKVAGHLRKRYRRAEQPLSDQQLLAATPDESELQEAVRSGIRQLPRPHAEALVLKYVNGLSTEEVSQVIRKSLPATNSLLQRARAAFRDAVGPELVGNARSMS